MKVIEAYDDLDWARNRTRTPATVTARLSWDGITVELDLSDKSKAELDERLADLLTLGTRVTSRNPPQERNEYTGNGTPMAKSRHYHKKIREWADANDLRSREHPEIAAYKTPSGSWYYPAWLSEAYEEAHR